MFLRYRNLLLLTIALLVQLFMLAYQLRRNRDVPLVRYATVLVISPFQKALTATARGAGSVWYDYVDLHGARRDSEALARQLDAERMQNNALREQAAEFKRLQALLDLREAIPASTTVAQVISSSSSQTARMITIDKGANAGIQADMPVMVAGGVVGKVLHVFPQAAQVLLITDPYSGVACLLQDIRVHGLLKGQNSSMCTLAYVSNNADIKPGQQVITSGEDQIYPKGLPVGTIVEAHPGPEFEQVLVRPSAPLDRLEEVVVLLTPPAERLAEEEMPAGTPKNIKPLIAAPKPSTPAAPAVKQAPAVAAAPAPATTSPAPSPQAAPPAPAPQPTPAAPTIQPAPAARAPLTAPPAPAPTQATPARTAPSSPPPATQAAPAPQH